MEHSFWLYAGFLAFVVAALLIDLKVFHSEARKVTTKEAGVWATIWIGLGIAFGIGVYFWMGPTSAGEYFAGFLIEKALSVDNIFVFLVIFGYFRVRPEHQHQVLFFGILGAIVFRGLFIAAGITLINRFEWVLYLMGALLLYSAYKIGRGTDSVHPEDNPVLKLFRRTFPTTSQYHGQKLFVREGGRRVATPLFVVLLVIEVTDVAFAVDSIPAIFAITRDPFIILTSNVFAILGLRALYFLLASSIERFHLLKYGLAFILAFVGVKMLAAEFWHPPIGLSLAVIVGALVVTVVASLKTTPSHEVPDELPDPENTLGLEEPEDSAQQDARGGGGGRT
ncbi:MAG: TerC family protein [Actinomycetota bacterium]